MLLCLLGSDFRLANDPAINVAFSLGYESTSAFIAMFLRAFGTTPTRYFEPSKKG
jgi:AraC-like DNA-binding protein